MHADSRISKITTLEEFRASKKEKVDKTDKTQAAPQYSEKQALIDRENGFVAVKNNSWKKSKSPTGAGPSISQKEALDKKLSQFFRASKTKDKKGRSDDRDDDREQREGGKVQMKKEVISTRAW